MGRLTEEQKFELMVLGTIDGHSAHAIDLKAHHSAVRGELPTTAVQLENEFNLG